MVNYKVLTTIQKEHMNNDGNNLERKKVHKSWFSEDTIDFWRHKRMYQSITPFAEFFHSAKWLSIGDGRFGLDSIRLKNFFGVDVFPSDISENMLKKGKEMGFYPEYGIENAESLSFTDNFFDIVFCKEAFHHFPRPIIALYEMIRVAKNAVVLIEPNDSHHNHKHSHEGCGNYAYHLSNNEVDKIVHGMDLAGMAYYEFNDAYEKGVEFELSLETNEFFKRIKEKIKLLDKRGNKGLTTTIIFKTKIDPYLKEKMIKYGYTFPNKKNNPIFLL